MQYISVPALYWPDFGTCSSAVRKQIARMEMARLQLLQRRQSQFVAPIVEWSPISGELLHPLSEKWRKSIATNAIPKRSEAAELSAFLFERSTIEASLQHSGSARWIEALISTASRITSGSVTALRTKHAVLSGDTQGITTAFRPANALQAELEVLHAHAIDVKIPITLRAVASMSTLLNIHPFHDGNGRTARLLFNVMISQGHPEVLYVPLCSAFDASMGGFELRLREATYHKNWLPLLTYFAAILQWVAEYCGRDEVTSAGSSVSHQYPNYDPAMQ